MVANAAYYKPVLFNSYFFGVKGRVGQVSGLGEKVTQSQRFFLGGRRVRGFDAAVSAPATLVPTRLSAVTP